MQRHSEKLTKATSQTVKNVWLVPKSIALVSKGLQLMEGPFYITFALWPRF